MNIITMRIHMQGFVVFDFAAKYAEARKDLAQWMSEGKLKRKDTIFKGGIEKAEEALIALFAGKNTGVICVHMVTCRQVRLTSCRQIPGASGRSRGSQGETIVDMLCDYFF